MSSRYDSCTIDTCPIEYSVYGYRPSLAASGALIALYTICMGIQVVMGLHYKTWWFMICMVLGCLVEILGYAGRILYWQDPWAQSGVRSCEQTKAMYLLTSIEVHYADCADHNRPCVLLGFDLCPGIKHVSQTVMVRMWGSS